MWSLKNSKEGLMKILKPHFWYYKSQRNGVFFLLFVIIFLQMLYSFIDFSVDEEQLSKKQTIQLLRQIDSLKNIEIEKKKPKIYPFNPSYITDYKGKQLGLSIEEIDRLHIFRKEGKFINSKKQFQKVTHISDSLLRTISSYFKFPTWVNNQKKKEKTSINGNSKKITSTIDVNLASAKDFQTIRGVNEFLAKRIVKYRKRIQGFTFQRQMLEVWKIDPKIADSIFKVFSIITLPDIEKVNVNTATFKKVLSNPYIDFELCKKIFDFRDEVAELQSIEELKKIEGFPLDKYERIVLYLEAK